MELREYFENLIKNENDLIGLSDDNLKKDSDGDYYDFLTDQKWDFFREGYSLGKKTKYIHKKLQPPDFTNEC